MSPTEGWQFSRRACASGSRHCPGLPPRAARHLPRRADQRARSGSGEVHPRVHRRTPRRGSVDPRVHPQPRRGRATVRQDRDRERQPPPGGGSPAELRRRVRPTTTRSSSTAALSIRPPWPGPSVRPLPFVRSVRSGERDLRVESGRSPGRHAGPGPRAWRSVEPAFWPSVRTWPASSRSTSTWWGAGRPRPGGHLCGLAWSSPSSARVARDRIERAAARSRGRSGGHLRRDPDRDRGLHPGQRHRHGPARPDRGHAGRLPRPRRRSWRPGFIVTNFMAYFLLIPAMVPIALASQSVIGSGRPGRSSPTGDPDRVSGNVGGQDHRRRAAGHHGHLGGVGRLRPDQRRRRRSAPAADGVQPAMDRGHGQPRAAHLRALGPARRHRRLAGRRSADGAAAPAFVVLPIIAIAVAQFLGGQATFTMAQVLLGDLVVLGLIGALLVIGSASTGGDPDPPRLGLSVVPDGPGPGSG